MASNIDRLILSTETHDEFLRSLMSSLVFSTKASNALPKGLDHSYANVHESYRDSNERAASQVASLMESLLGFAGGGAAKGLSLCGDAADPRLYETVSEAIDGLLDRADLVLNGSAAAGTDAAQRLSSSLREGLARDKARLLQESVKDMPKPQRLFAADIDNARDTPFAPRLVDKHHAKVPYSRQLEMRPTESETETETESEGRAHFYAHPYEHELLTLAYPPFLLADPSQLTPQYPDPLRKCDWVDGVEGLRAMVRELRDAREIAVDLEHHSVRSFQGLTCLMQISSRTKDYLVDTLALRRELHVLGEIFADPAKVKVLHGCERDVLWLQRDLGLYIVTCFDTFHAAKALQLPALSLAHLVKTHCGVTLDKKYQLADWRERPLSPEMREYARKDTHYLLYVYDLLRKQLWQRMGAEGIESVLSASKKNCLARYEKEVFDATGFRALLANGGASKSLPSAQDLNTQQENALRKLWDWRDRVAREEDESPQFIMSNAELLRIGRKVPRYEQDVLSCSPLTEYVRSHLSEVVALMLAASVFEPVSLSVSLAQSAGSLAPLRSERVRDAVDTAQRALFTLNPTPLPTPSQSSKNEETAAPCTLSVDELLRSTEWNTPLVSEARPSGETAFLFDAAKPSFVSASSREQMKKSVDDLFAALSTHVNLEQRLLDLVKDVDPAPSTDAAVPADNAQEETKDDLIEDMPQSFEEIYQLSSRNRQKNKDKKRSRDKAGGEDTKGPSANEPFKSGSNAFDTNQYFTASPVDEKEQDTDATLEFAKSIGWVKNDEDARRLAEEHNSVLASQQSAEESQSGAGSADVRRSQEKASSWSKSPLASFDYSAVSHPAMGVTSQSLDMGKKNASKQKGGHKSGGQHGQSKFRSSSSAVPSNPFLPKK